MSQLVNVPFLNQSQQASNFSMIPSPSNYWAQTPLNQQNYASMAAYNANPTGYQHNMSVGTNAPGMFQNITQGLGAFTALAQLYGMFQNLGLQKKAFKFGQEGTKRNFNAQATAYNESVASKETARQAHAANNGLDYGAMYKYGTGEKVEKWT